MKKRIILILAIIMILSVFSQAFGQLNDINGHWAEGEIRDLVNKGIINGYEDSTFRPEREISRVEFVSIINKALGLTDVEQVGFEDVTRTWHIEEVGKALAVGYINGYGDGRFGPDDKITRQDAATIIGRAFKLEELSNPSSRFNDDDDIRDHARGFVNVLWEKRYISGYSDNTFKPLNTIIRAEVATMVASTLAGETNDKPEPEPKPEPDPTPKIGNIVNIEYLRDNRIKISASDNLSYIEDTVESPDRIVFDFKDFDLSHKGPYINPSDSSNIKEIRFAQQDGFTRVTIELTGDYHYTTKKVNNSIEITVDKPGVFKLAIDTGHGLFTRGKEVPDYIGVGQVKEWTLNDKITREMIKLLKQYENVEVLRLDDPTGRVDIPLSERARKANEWGADLLISNHHNAGIGGRIGGGLVVYRFPNSTLFTRQMQQNLYNNIVAQTGLKGNRATPLGEANFAILRQCNMASVLIEHGFMDSPSDMNVIMQESFAPRSARGVVNFLVDQYDLKRAR